MDEGVVEDDGNSGVKSIDEGATEGEGNCVCVGEKGLVMGRGED